MVYEFQFDTIQQVQHLNKGKDFKNVSLYFVQNSFLPAGYTGSRTPY
jgi:hypothetical protein